MKILIVEDEQKTAELLKGLIESHPAYAVVEICDTIKGAVAYLRTYQADLDLIFMDIQLSDGQSFEIFDKIAVTLPVVFCTSYNDFMLKAFKNNGIDYILKPFNQNDIHQAILKVEQLKGTFTTHAFNKLNFKDFVQKEKTYQTSFLVRFREKIHPVLVADIAFVYLDNDVTYLYNFKGEKYSIFKTLDEIENAISPQQFFRINRQIIVNRQAIKDIESGFNNKIIVSLILPMPEKAVVPRPKVTGFLSWVEKG
jgi:two-component system, LytTR family, response regulator LytT